MLQVKTATGTEWQVDFNRETILVNDAPFEWDLLPTGERTFHIIRNGKSFSAEVIEADYKAKTFTIKVNGNKHTITVKDRFDLLLDKLGMGQAHSSKVNDIKAPMPGLILDIKVELGQEVKKGDPILILEAMKMENIIKSPGDGVVKAIKASVRQNVEKGHVLLEFH